jgi:hypothetical protein
VRESADPQRFAVLDDSNSNAHLLDDERAIRVVLTVAHLDHDPAHNDDANLRAWCQLHHLRYDAALHARNAAETRRRKLIDAGQGTFPEVTP